MIGIFLILSLLHACYAGDEKCTASGGICKNRYSCNLGYSKIETGKCAGNRDRICCVPKCVEAGGECKHRSTCTLSANEIKTGKCPGDKDNICCVPKEPDSALPKCNALGGTCENIYTGCGNGFIVRKQCPGSNSIGCCIPFDSNDDDKHIKKHMEKEEGYMFLEGYIPTSKSGVTIATGYDLGHGPDIFNCLNDGVLKSKLTPYKGLKSKAAVASKGLSANNLKVTLEEAKEIDRCMLDHNKKGINRCVNKDSRGEITSVSDCGTAVLISLKHWCGEGGLALGMQRKCNTGKQSSPNLKEFCTSKGSDSDLERTLQNVYNEHVREGVVSSHVEVRIKGELDFLKKCLGK